MYQKRGQFYLTAAVIIVGVIIGFATISNYSKKNDFTKVSDLAEELKIESSNVLDYDLKNNANNFSDFTQKFSEYAGDDVTIIYIVNQSGTLDIYEYINGNKEGVNSFPTDNGIKINLDEKNYTIELQKENNFHFIIYQELRGEKYVVAN